MVSEKVVKKSLCSRYRNTAEFSTGSAEKLPKGCFLVYAEKKARNELRKTGKLSKGDRIAVLSGEKSYKSEATLYIAKKILSCMPVEISEVNSFPSSKKFKAVFVQWSVEDECEELLKEVTKKSKPKKRKSNEIRLLSQLTDDEIKAFAESVNLKFRKIKTKKSPERKIIDQLEEQCPGYKQSMMRCSEQIRQLQNKRILNEKRKKHKR